MILGHDLAVADSLVSRPSEPISLVLLKRCGEPFPRVLEEMEPFVEHALHEDSLAAIDLGDGQKLASCVRINTQKMRYLVRSA